MKIINRNNTIGTLCLFLLAAVLPVSCLKDDYAAKEKATVQVTFTTRAEGGTTVADDALAENERMQTLRVIVAKDDNILYNVKYEEKDFDKYDNGQRYKTVTFSELVTKDETDRTFVFYAIANEEGIADWPTQITSLEQLPEDITLSTTSGLIPQTAKQSITVDIPQEGNGIQKKTMQLEFVVAKVCLTIENTSTAAQTVENISLSGVNMTSTPLFAEEETLSDVTDGSVSLGEMTIPVENNGTPSKSTVYAYFYENTGGDYNLKATWGTSSNKEFDIKTLGNLSEIKRGTELDITITIKKNVTTPEDFFIQVNTWDSADMEIPSFQ